MMGSPYGYYTSNIEGKTKNQIMNNIYQLKSKINNLKKIIETPGYIESFDPGADSEIGYYRDCLELAKQELKNLGGSYMQLEPEKKSELFDSNIPAISKITFSIGSYFEQYKIYTINIEDNGVYFYINQSSFPESSKSLGELYDLCTKEYFFHDIKYIYLGEWDEYYINSDILDGTQWKLTVEFSNGQKPFKSGGSNAYPYNFGVMLWKFHIDIKSHR